MAHSSRPVGKPTVPGRGRRTRVVTNPSGPRSPQVAQVIVTEESAPPAPPRARLAFTKRALVLLLLLIMLAGSYLGSLRAVVMQSKQMAATEQQIVERSARIAELESELERWRDPSYVKAQARARLGWVMPGEVGYRVIGLDGEVLSTASDIERSDVPAAGGTRLPWWEELSSSIAVADRLEVEPAAEPEDRVVE